MDTNATHAATTTDAQTIARVGDWMMTHSGRRFWPMDPRPTEIDFRDIAHALSLVCRYGGHVRRFYSVAEHSWLLAHHFLDRGDYTWARYALLHDAPEAYIGDMVRPLKSSMKLFKAVDQEIERAIFRRAGLGDAPIPREVHAADAAIIGDEASALFRPEALEGAGWHPPEGLGVIVVGDPPHVAERNFMLLFARLFPELQEG
jgi:uncharacterized protein